VRLVCENHPLKAWPEECDCGAGMNLRDHVRDELKRLAAYGSQGDTEANHVVADELLCLLLRELGHSEIVDLFGSISKWYA
jgi:hypothetical protein